MRGFARGRARRLTGSVHNDNGVRNPISTRSVGTRLRLRLGFAFFFGKEEAHEYRHTRPHTHRADHRRLVYSKFKTLPGRLELPTLRLTASRSNQLSYGSTLLTQRGWSVWHFALRQWQVGCWSHAVTRARANVHTGARPPHRRLALRLSELNRT
mgnify:CR=1 FL=1